MSPARAKTSDEAVVAAARAILEQGGTLSMQQLADAVGTTAPALYKRFPHKDAILDAVVCEVLDELRGVITRASRKDDPRAALLAMGRAYRAFAKRVPHLYPLLFADRAEGPGVHPARVAAVVPLLERLQELVPAEQDLPMARMLTAFLHGFISMELGSAFKLGGSVQDAFELGLEKLVASL